MEIYPSEYGRNGNGQVRDKSCSTSFNDLKIQANGQGWKKVLNSTQKWIKTATSEDFRRGFIGRQRAIVTSLGNKPYNIHKKQYLHDDNTPSEENASTDESLKSRTKFRPTIIIVLVSSCLVTLAVALTVLFVFAKPHNEKLNSPHMFVITEGEITVLQTFTDDLHNKRSDAYKKFTADFSSVMENGLQKEFPLRRRCSVTNLQNGSIIVSFILFMETENINITDSSLKTVVKSAMRNGTGNSLFGNFSVNASSLSFLKIDVLKEPSTAATLATITTRTLTTTKTSIPNTTRTPISFTQTIATTKTSATAGITPTTTTNIPSTVVTTSTNETNPNTNLEQSTKTSEGLNTITESTSTTSNGKVPTDTSTVYPPASTTDTETRDTARGRNELNTSAASTTKFNSSNVLS